MQFVAPELTVDETLAARAEARAARAEWLGADSR